MNHDITDQIIPFSGFDTQMPESNYISNMPMQQVKTAYTTAVAVQERRSISRVTANVLQEAALAGTDFYYRWTITTKSGEKRVVQGPSIDLAMCLVRNYGNCVIDVSVDETTSHYVFKGTLIDLESGFTCPRLFRQRKSQTIGSRFDQDRQEDLVFQIGQSKAIRNAVVKAMPSWLINQAIEKAHEAEIRNIKPENIAAARAKCIHFFSTFGVDVKRLEERIGRKVDDWSNEDIVELREIATALKEGHVNIHVLFPAAEPEKQKPQEASTDAPKQEKEPQPEQTKENPWNRENWIYLKTPGLTAHAKVYADTFIDQPADLRKAFADKWAKMADIGDFPFDDKGQLRETQEQLALFDVDWNEFELWLDETYPAANLHMMRNFLTSYCAKGGVPVEYTAKRMMEDTKTATDTFNAFKEWLGRQKIS